MRWLPVVLVVTLDTVANAAPHCPPRLNEIAQAVWHHPSVRPTCIPVRATVPLTLVTDAATFDNRPVRKGDESFIGYAAIVDDHGAVVWHESWARETPGDWKTWTVVDLDGDNHAELVEYDDYDGHMGTGVITLAIHSIVNGVSTEGWTEGAYLTLARREGKGGNNCESTYRLIRDDHAYLIEVVGKRHADPNLSAVRDDCPANGLRMDRWDGTRLDLKSQ